jgi:hypothetical protein
MLINKTTGEIAYHSLILKRNGLVKFKQYGLKNKKGDIKFIEPRINKKHHAKIYSTN